MSRLALIAYACIGAALAFTAGVGVGWVKGSAKAEREHAIDGWRAFADAVRVASAVGAQVATIGAQLRDQLAASHTTEAANKPRIREALNEYPEFAGQRRPAALERVRRDELEAVRAAAEAGRLRH